MKIQFHPDLDYQREAVASLVDVFEGQGAFGPKGGVSQPQPEHQPERLAVGNDIELTNEEILANVHKVQRRNGLAPVRELAGMNFTVEMETGTGKTYVYLRSIFELHRKYGFTKHIVVVPSIAIKEGVHKTLQMTQTHFKTLYKDVRFDYFVYDAQKIGQVRSFATSEFLQVMVINIDAFNKGFEENDRGNIIYRPNDQMSGLRPIELIQATNPVVIIDEPQSVDTTQRRRNAIASLNPLCTVRYSATHKDRYNQIFRLDAVDAYERKLVKQVEVAGIDVQGRESHGYVKLLRVDNKKGRITALLELDVQTSAGAVERKQKIVRFGDDLQSVSGGRSVYQGTIVEEICLKPNLESVRFTGKAEVLRLGHAVGEAAQDGYKRLQIRRTIQEHLDKELRFRHLGIKVLSLFFIDRVSNYRCYSEQGTPQPGKYARWFKEEYERLVRIPKYHELFADPGFQADADGVHGGYFAIDKKKDAIGARRLRDSRGSGAHEADEGAYKLIMRDKERLLRLDTKLKFIFSHSALNEGWDNPNVFQICTLNERSSFIKKRQEIGRGLRIAVNQQGERLYGFDVNTLTVIANESYEEFASKLQKEMEEETGSRFGVVDMHIFASIPVDADENRGRFLGTTASQEIWEHLKASAYIDAQGQAQERLRCDLRSGGLKLPQTYAQHSEAIRGLLSKVVGCPKIKNAAKRNRIRLNKAVHLGDEFRAFWDRVKFRVAHQVQFDTETLIRTCADRLRESMLIGRARFVYRKSSAAFSRDGLVMGEPSEQLDSYDDKVNLSSFDVVSTLQAETNLTRRTIVEILLRSGKLELFKENPQKFVDQAVWVLRRQIRSFAMQGLGCKKFGQKELCVQEIPEESGIYGQLVRAMTKRNNLACEKIVYDSRAEARFVCDLERDDDVKLYAKLPGFGRGETSLGTRQPDWVVLAECEGEDRLYLVVES